MSKKNVLLAGHGGELHGGTGETVHLMYRVDRVDRPSLSQLCSATVAANIHKVESCRQLGLPTLLANGVEEWYNWQVYQKNQVFAKKWALPGDPRDIL